MLCNTSIKCRYKVQTITGWTAVKRGVKINYDLETSPLEIRTDSTLGSNERLAVLFSGVGEFWVNFRSTPQYLIGHCTQHTDFPTALPAATDKVWKITVTRNSVIRVVIHCNDQEVVNIPLSDSTCSKSIWSTTWSKTIAKIEFQSSDKASDYYRAGNGKLSQFNWIICTRYRLSSLHVRHDKVGNTAIHYSADKR